MLPTLIYILGVVTFICFEFYLVRSYWKNLLAKKEALKILKDFTNHGSKITLWLKDHLEELRADPLTTLNNYEFVNLINEDQKLYERVLEKYPDYPNIIMPPKELHLYFIELVQGKYKQTH